MKLFAYALMMIMMTYSLPAFAEVASLDSTEGEVVMEDDFSESYKAQIKRLNQSSNDLSLQIRDHKEGNLPAIKANDGMQVTLVKVQR